MKFPEIKPTARQFTMGDYPNKVYRALSGATFRRNFGNKQTGYKLELQFRNIGDITELQRGSGTLDIIMNHYNTVEGTFESFGLPDKVFRGMNVLVRDLFYRASDIKWHYAAPPTIESVKEGVSNVTVSLVGDLEI